VTSQGLSFIGPYLIRLKECPLIESRGARRFASHADTLCPSLFHSLPWFILKLLVDLCLLWSWCAMEYPFQTYVPRVLLLSDLLNYASLSSHTWKRTGLEAGYLVSHWLCSCCSSCYGYCVPRFSFFLAERGKLTVLSLSLSWARMYLLESFSNQSVWLVILDLLSRSWIGLCSAPIASSAPNYRSHRDRLLLSGMPGIVSSTLYPQLDGPWIWLREALGPDRVGLWHYSNCLLCRFCLGILLASACKAP